MLTLRTDGGWPEMRDWYFLATLLRVGYTEDPLTPFGQGPLGPFNGPPQTYRDYNGRRRTLVLPYADSTVISTCGLVSNDWPYVLLAGLPTVNTSGVFAGNVMAAVLQVFNWTWPHLDLLLVNGPQTQQMIFSGHSFGGALSVLYAWAAKLVWPMKDIRAITFGSPRYADATFASALPLPVLRVENFGDPVPGLPPWPAHADVGEGWTINRSGNLFTDYPLVQMPDGRSILGSAATIEERQPRARLQNTASYFLGTPDPALLSVSNTNFDDGHAIGEYTRRLRRFFRLGGFDNIDGVNNALNVRLNLPWRAPTTGQPLPLLTPLSLCQGGGCNPAAC